MIPAVGDEPWEGGWVSPLNAAIYPPAAVRRIQTEAPRCPPFKKDSVSNRPNGDPATPVTVCPGLHRFARARQEDEYTVVWWDPSTLDLDKEAPLGLRRDDLIVKHVDVATVEAGLAAHASWRNSAREARARGSEPSIKVQTASEWAVSGAALETTQALPSVSVVEVPGRHPRPGGRRYGTLVHALLATVPLDAKQQAIRDLAGAHGRVLGAPDEEVQSAIETAEAVLREPLLARACRAMAAGRCRRETPVALSLADGALIEGVIDLAFEEADGFTVLDFKTDRDLERGIGHYTRQLQFYAEAIRCATGRSATPVLMRI